MLTEGVINIDKPAEWTSHDVVAKLRSVLKMKRVGHTGTLDPMATGVLLICFGPATKMSDLLMNSEKEYEVTLRLGEDTDTQDATGKVLRSCTPPSFSTQTLEETLSTFVGTISQMPPIYSAKKIGGVPLYKLARKGLDIEREPREITIKGIRLDKVQGNDLFLTVSCSKGTYVRTLCSDIGKKLSVFGHARAIRRTRSGYFSITSAIALTTFIELHAKGEWENQVVSIRDLKTFYPNTCFNGLGGATMGGDGVAPLQKERSYA
ncbi:MAG: tRNA pseudouridine(55) synthase TruB [Nitrospirota bacterium]